MSLCDLSYFFNKKILELEPNHLICKIRTFGLGFLSIIGSKEYYEYIMDG